MGDMVDGRRSGGIGIAGDNGLVNGVVFLFSN